MNPIHQCFQKISPSNHFFLRRSRAITLIIMSGFYPYIHNQTWTVFYDYIPVYEIWIQYTKFVPNYFQIGPIVFNKKIFKVFPFLLPWQPEFCIEWKSLKGDLLKRNCLVYFDSLRPSWQIFRHVGTGLPWLNPSTKQRIKHLAQGHKAMPPVRLEPITPQSQITLPLSQHAP